MRLAPICLFTYNRLIETRMTIQSLQRNYLASESDLIIYSDGAKHKAAESGVNQVREFLKTINGFKSVKVVESKFNMGLANSIISGVSQVLKNFDNVIVLEDDLILSRNFLNFMNQSLHLYQSNSLVFSVSGYSQKLKFPLDYSYDAYFKGRATSWGWATWKDRWQLVDWKVNKEELKKTNSFKELNRYGYDLKKMLIDHVDGKNDSWAIRFTYYQIKSNKVTVAPVISKVQNIGFGENATHCKDPISGVKVAFDNTKQKKFSLPNKVEIKKDLELQLRSRTRKMYRVIFKILNKLPFKNKIANRIKNVEYVNSK
ncbi:sugar transferase [Zunongwangia profunda]|uniref:sugar transferase n=1 Tax=Zunongwangia profunda TaxID=398743 RepID=UPI00248D8344|nr:sugar transferase [Zunongwangia profunda]|tara:strand:- start:14134 stop:15078 length:945 start_codon:yes stop_codon:yes gene_type:complete